MSVSSERPLEPRPGTTSTEVTCSAGAQGARARWRGARAPLRYEGVRWTSARHRQRDPRRIARLLDEHAAPPLARILDVPCGSGRLAAVLEERAHAYVGLDVSPDMLAAAAGRGSSRHLLGDVLRLPFPDRSFDAVVSCRLLHHLDDLPTLRRAVAELVRVSSHWVLVTFWDAGALPERWRRARGTDARSAARTRPRRFAHTRADLAAALGDAGATVVAMRSSLRLLSRQTYALAERHG